MSRRACRSLDDLRFPCERKVALVEPDLTLDNAVRRWQSLREQGRTAAVGDLCVDCPEKTADLSERLRVVASMVAFLGIDPESDPRRTAEGAQSKSEVSPLSDTRALNVPGYEVLGELGRGGMGVVYSARQIRPERVVALKMIPPSLLMGATALRRFRSEAQAMARLDHPHIVSVYEVGESEARPFFSMKLMEGGSLAGRGEALKEDPAAGARLVAAIARAVHHAHQRGVIHRDLKPANILLDAEGRPYVADFGLARCVQQDVGLTNSGAILGTPSYMAPEQAVGNNAEITTLADVYALGAILYELITGRPPFRGENSMETLAHVVERAPEPPQAVNPKVDFDLATVCLKCLAKDPSQRYANSSDLADDLDLWLAGDPIRARPPDLFSLTKSLVRQHFRPVAKIAGVGIAVGLVIGLHLLATDVQPPLSWNLAAYRALALPEWGWLQPLVRLTGWFRISSGPAFGLSLMTLGLLAVLAARPRRAVGDVITGMSAGVVAGVVALSTGLGWALIYGTALSAALEDREALAIKYSPLTDARPGVSPIVYGYHTELGRPATLTITPGWQLDRYQRLRGMPLDEQADLLHRKQRADLMIGVQTGIWYCLAAVAAVALFGTAEATVAGMLLRRHGSVRRVLLEYTKLTGPAVVILYGTFFLAVNLFQGRSTFRPETWGTAVALSVAVLAAARGPWLLRLALYLAWIATLVAMMTDVWPVHSDAWVLA
jgi:serine/threonine protein kinase